MSSERVAKPASAELHPGPGFRLRRPRVRPTPETVAGFNEFASADVSDLLNRLYTMSAEIKNLTDPSLRLIGPACTVKVFPGDNLMVHKSLDLAEPGDVIVVDAGGSPMNGVLGDLVSTKARHRGIAGFVVDGLVRDLPRIRDLGDFPVFARGTTPIGPLHRGPGEINYPISAGGIVVHAGDIIVADLDGVVVVPNDVADSLLERLRAQREAQAAYLAAIQRGEFSNVWVDSLLAEAGAFPEEDA